MPRLGSKKNRKIESLKVVQSITISSLARFALNYFERFDFKKSLQPNLDVGSGQRSGIITWPDDQSTLNCQEFESNVIESSYVINSDFRNQSNCLVYCLYYCLVYYLYYCLVYCLYYYLVYYLHYCLISCLYYFLIYYLVYCLLIQLLQILRYKRLKNSNNLRALLRLYKLKDQIYFVMLQRYRRVRISRYNKIRNFNYL